MLEFYCELVKIPHYKNTYLLDYIYLGGDKKLLILEWFLYKFRQEGENFGIDEHCSKKSLEKKDGF